MVGGLVVVYFDQQTHACTCVLMVENNGKHSKNSIQYFPVANLARQSKLVLWIQPSHQYFGAMVICKFGAVDLVLRPRPLSTTIY